MVLFSLVSEKKYIDYVIYHITSEKYMTSIRRAKGAMEYVLQEVYTIEHCSKLTKKQFSIIDEFLDKVHDYVGAWKYQNHQIGHNDEMSYYDFIQEIREELEKLAS